VVARNEIGLEVNAEKTQYMVMSITGGNDYSVTRFKIIF
jgi:hypothetical protein